MGQPQLTDLPTIGEATARKLAEHGFHSVADLAAATAEQLRAVPGFGEARACTVREAAARLLGEEPDVTAPEKANKGKKKKKSKKKNKKDDKKKSDKKKGGKKKKK